MTVCSRCILDSHIPHITFNVDGTCNYCSLHDKWQHDYGDETKLQGIVKKIKREGKNNRYDCIVGISGGCDSSYMLYKCVEFGLRPLAVHWNNNWNTEIAENNIRAMVRGLGVDYFEMGVDQKEYDNICRSFLLASVPDADIPNDIALTKVLYVAAEKFGVKHILEGHSFLTEGTTPIGWSYMDGKYIKSVQKLFGTVPLKTYPNLLFDEWLRYLLVSKTKRIRFLWYLQYDKPQVKKMLHEKYGWNDYSGQHGENEYTIFVSNYLQPVKFGIDLRWIFLAAQVRSGFITREEASFRIKKTPTIEQALYDKVKRRLGFNEKTFQDMMQLPVKSHKNYKTYSPLFRRYKGFFQMMARMNLVPQTFYEKYTA